MASSHRVIFTPSGIEADAEDGATVLDVARQSGVDLDSVCGGRGICGRCQVIPSLGDFAKWAITSTAEHLSEVGATEMTYSGKRPMEPDARLGCQARIRGAVVLDVPPGSQLHAPVIRKEINIGELRLDPVTSLHVVDIDPRDLDLSQRLEAVIEALEREWGLVPTDVAPGAGQELESLASEREGTVTVQLRRSPTGRVLQRVRLGASLDNLGVAIDIGSTTIAGHLIDLGSGEILASEGLMNSQIRLGEDLMSRVSYVMMNANGAIDLRSLVRESVGDLITALVRSAGRDGGDITEIVLVGNPIMHHSFLGFDVVPLGQMPFELATENAVELPANQLEIPAEHAWVYFAPCIAGHVGADSAAAILSEGTSKGVRKQLLVDVGTNAEIVFGNADRILAASSPTGPAFEGAQISHGQRATKGAIERVRIDKNSFEPAIKVIGCDHWSTDPGFAEAIGETGVTGICGSGIIEAVAELFLSGLMSSDGTLLDNRSKTKRVVADGRTFSFVLYNGEGPVAPQEIVITQNDIRAIQLAKAALRAGIDLLLEHADSSGPEEIRLAGAFGAQIDPVYAMVLGLLPDCEVEVVQAVGNAAGSGAARLLLSFEEREEIERLVRQVEKIETATESRFQEMFVEAMAFPHATADHTHLARTVELPSSPLTSTPGDRNTKRRGRRKD
ncbi:MAG: ASKHA domain-containing protein [Actinomycetota bacterium]|nr:ASKHA domain-containing protein [Actinomycetota bacterium]